MNVRENTVPTQEELKRAEELTSYISSTPYLKIQGKLEDQLWKLRRSLEKSFTPQLVVLVMRQFELAKNSSHGTDDFHEPINALIKLHEDKFTFPQAALGMMIDMIFASKKPAIVVKAFKTLISNQIFLQVNADPQVIFSMLAKHEDLVAFANHCVRLKENKCLNLAYFNWIVAEKFPSLLVGNIINLHQRADGDVVGMQAAVAKYSHPNFTVVAWRFFKDRQIPMVYFDRTMSGVDETFRNDTLNMLETLKNADILTEENAALVFERDKSNEASLSVLAKYDLFSQKTFELVMRHKHPSEMVSAILELKPGGMLWPDVKAYNDNNLLLLAAHDNPHAMAKAIKTLIALGSFTPDNIALIAKAVEPELVAQALANLPEKATINMDMLAAKNPAAYTLAKTFLQQHPALAIEIDAILQRHEQPHYLAQVLVKLRDANISFNDYLLKCESFSALEELNDLLGAMIKWQLSLPEFIDKCLNVQQCVNAVECYHALEEKDFFTAEHFKAVLNHSNIHAVYYDVRRLRLLTKERVDEILKPASVANTLAALFVGTQSAASSSVVVEWVSPKI